MNHQSASPLRSFATAGVAAMPAPTTGYAPEVPGALERLENTLARAQDRLDLLDNRLTGQVARAHAPADVGNSAKAVMNTALGTRLDQMNDAALGIEARLQSLIERLEF